MPKYSANRISEYLAICNTLLNSNAIRGQALEDLSCYILGRVPGIEILDKRTKNTTETEEIDISFYNDNHPNGLKFLPNYCIAECKNWSHPVGSIEVSWFDRKMLDTNSSHGFFIALNGITGNPDLFGNSHIIVRDALREGRYLIVIKQDEIRQLSTTDNFVELIKFKIGQLKVRQTIV